MLDPARLGDSAARSRGSRARRAVRPSSTTRQVVPVVPWSIARSTCRYPMRRSHERDVDRVDRARRHVASRSSGRVPRTARQRRPASFAERDARLGVLERDRPRRVDAEPLDREADIPRDAACRARTSSAATIIAQLARDPRSRHDRLDLGPERARDDRHRHAGRRIAGWPRARQRSRSIPLAANAL